MKRHFDCFVGIDWSGDKKKWQKGIKVACARSGSLAPELVSGAGPSGRWSRTEVVEWLLKLAAEKRALIGLDFAFGFPVIAETPCDSTLNWEYVDNFCRSDQNFYGGRFFRDTGAPHSCLTNRRGHQGTHYVHSRLRDTERAAAQVKGATPQSVFNAIGGAQVGPSSISGMRMLSHLKRNCARVFSIWPFDDIDDERSVIVEIFPRYFALSRGQNAKMKDFALLNAALLKFESEPVVVPPNSEDEGDALLSAAALRNLSGEHKLFCMSASYERRQGWIFGVPFGGAA